MTNHEIIKKYFPIEISTTDYIYAGPSIRDERSRIVELKVKIDNILNELYYFFKFLKIPILSLDLNERSKDKFIKLVGSRFDKKTKTLTLKSEK